MSSLGLAGAGPLAGGGDGADDECNDQLDGRDRETVKTVGIRSHEGSEI